MDQPWQRIHFAGEHLRRVEFGLEAAMETAERAVLEILA
jgi:monoamine oxidase